MARTASRGRPVSVRTRVGKTGTKFYCEKELRQRGERHRYTASGDTEQTAILKIAVKVHQDGFIEQAREIAMWVRSGWPAEPIPEVLGIDGAPVRPADVKKHLIGNLLDTFLEDRKTAVRPGTYQRDKGKIKNHIRPGLGHLYVEDLDERALRNFFHDLSQKPKVKPYYDPRTQAFVTPGRGEKLLGVSPLRDIYTILNKVLKDATKRDYISTNPLSGIKRESRANLEAKVDRSDAFEIFDKLIDDLSPAEARQFMLAFLGLRQGERLGIGRDSVRRQGEAVLLVIDRQLSREGLEITPLLKTRASQRSFTVPPSVGLYLLDLVKWREGIGPIGPYDTLIGTQDGRPLRHQRDTADWHAVLTSRGLPIYRQHLLRHWAATHLARMGVSENLAQGLLGHSDVLMTRYYTARDALDIGTALTGLADDLLPDLAYLNRPGAPSLDAVMNRDASVYVDALLTQAADLMGTASLTAWEQVDEFQHEITIESGAERIGYRGVIPAGIEPARLLDLIMLRWDVVRREVRDTAQDVEDF